MIEALLSAIICMLCY